MPRVILNVKLYSTQEAADLLGVSYGTINKYISEGKIEARIIGGRKYITEMNLKHFLLGSEAENK